MEETIRERVASVEQHYKEQASRTIAERSGPGHEAQGVLEPQAVVLLCDL